MPENTLEFRLASCVSSALNIVFCILVSYMLYKLIAARVICMFCFAIAKIGALTENRNCDDIMCFVRLEHCVL